MSGVWVQVVQFLMALSLLIVLHEGGHFFFARLFKTRVEKFYLFFDFLFPFSNILPFSLLKKKIGDTVWGIGWFPLGGYVKIAGMVDESMDKEALAKPPEPWEFRSKKAWQRLLIMLGGIIVNVLLAILIYAMILFVWGEKRMPVSQMKGGIEIRDSLGYKIGLKDGDHILSVNDRQVYYYDDIIDELIYAKTITVQRNGKHEVITLPKDYISQMIDKRKAFFGVAYAPTIVEVTKGSSADKAGLKAKDYITVLDGVAIANNVIFDSIRLANKSKLVSLVYVREGKSYQTQIQLSDSGTLGIQRGGLSILDMEKLGMVKLDTHRYGFLECFPAGIRMAGEQLNKYIRQFRLILDFKTKAYKGLGGFASMANIFPQQWNWEAFWTITAFLSIVLAFMNLLPIPGLDGGYVLFTLIEMITGRKVNEKVLEVATTIGLVLLLGLMLYANGMDIFRIFKK
ncbi:RIP metalloprotease RseP [Taibaiella koreensis]|uniref:RIP metalloprotease RseP n=1 Tax=Taibaiella koreensis TaxID=1268548 RepID=UPI000E59BDD9|nr:RIP metalloprotease RseP [Taibaiella koreensis]